MKIARCFNAGFWHNANKSRRDRQDREILFSAFPPVLDISCTCPGVKTPGYFHSVAPRLRGLRLILFRPVCIVRAMSPPENKISPLKNPVTSLWGVGAERTAQLARLEIFTIEDLLLHRPKRYEDRRHFRKISELTKDEPFTARGKIVALGLKRFRGAQQIRLKSSSTTARRGCIAAGGTCRSCRIILRWATRFSSSAN